MKKKARRVLIILEIMILAGLLAFGGINLYMKYVADKEFATLEELEIEKQEYDAAIILGAQVKEGGKLSLMLKERVDMGIALYKAGITDRLIMSGDHGREDYDEVNAMKDYAIAAGVPSEHIFMDHAGFSTYDTMYRAREIFQVEDAVVVTQEYHLYRAVYNAKAMDMDVKGIFCDRDVYAGDKYRKLREALARVKDFGYCMIKPEPKCLGEAIPVSGNGDMTNDRE